MHNFILFESLYCCKDVINNVKCDWCVIETITALFNTGFRAEFPFDPLEILAFVVIG